MSTVLQARSRLGVAVRVGSPEKIEAARRDLAAENIAAFVTKTVAAAPPLTSDQRDRIAALLQSGAGEGAWK